MSAKQKTSLQYEIEIQNLNNKINDLISFAEDCKRKAEAMLATNSHSSAIIIVALADQIIAKARN